MRLRTLLAVVPLALALTACGTTATNDGVASAGGGTTAPSASPSASVDRQTAALKFAQCMRENGVDMEDPGPEGGIRIKSGPGDQAKVQKAQEACRHFMKDVAGGEGGRKPDQQTLDKLAKFAQCMRENGIDMEDPAADGRIQIQIPQGTPEEKVNKARAICNKLAPEGIGA
ncbi:hypothetical protein [Rhizohabitans arisaemae]|uniref:hypothetical protein n=1 Tax=Rhizohabitans arisaemae TaxID=2720610 RepID=UPI0024B1A893|nr:hypothetical protein [Rhizohabitans arisaemae]